MKSLQKTFDILEYVVLQNGRPVTPSDAAENLKINLVTCTRIMGELTGRGYLVQISRKTGYIPGPMIPSLMTRHNVYEQIAVAAQNPIAELSAQLNRQVNIAVLHKERRIMLCYHLTDPDMKPWDRFTFTDHWNTATGRLLIAALDDNEAKKMIRSCGLKKFPVKELEQMRRENMVCFEQNELSIIGRSISITGYPVMAFGFGVPQERTKEAIKLSAQTAEKIRLALCKPNQAY